MRVHPLRRKQPSHDERIHHLPHQRRRIPTGQVSLRIDPPDMW
jgi:hypothetical protein